tara:strand:- start:1295 stop:2431 length:1137 start_codon:yes stop_codon:yes gene_type:complete
MATFYGTNIPTAGYSADQIKKFNTRIKNEVDDGNSKGANDVIFDIAWSVPGHDYEIGMSKGSGQGNPTVSKVHSGIWEVTADIDNKKSWAESYINSPNDVYVQDNGNVVTKDPNTGKVLVNQKDSDGNWGSGPVGAVISGDQSGLDANMTTWLSGNAVAGGPTKSNVNTTVQGGSDQMNLLAYRPWTQKYANKYLTGGADSLLTMDKSSLSPEYSLAYQPGEFRDPNTWASWESNHLGHIPEGAWRRATMNPATAANLAAGTSAYTAGGDPRQNIWAKQNVGGVADYKYLNAPGWNVKALDASVPGGVRQASTPWDFTAPAHSQGNVAWQDWTPKSMNLTTPDSLAWQGLLNAMDTSPAITPGLLTKGKGGPISFDGG